MAIRQLTKKFESYSIREFNRKYKKKSIVQYIFVPDKGDSEQLNEIANKKGFSNLITKKGLSVDSLGNVNPTEIVNYILGLFSEDKLISLIQLGNYNCSEEEAAKYLDNYIDSDSENSPITAFITIISELERDRHYLATFGVNFDSIASMVLKTVRDSVSKVNVESLFDRLEDNKEDTENE